MERSAIGSAVLAASLWLAACGGNVVVDGAGGGGGAGGAGGSLPSTGPGPTTGVGGAEQQSVCEKFCAAAGSCGQGAGCQQSCEDLFGTTPLQCKDELAAYLSCFVDALPSVGCNPNQQICVAQANAYASCLNVGTGGAGGVGGSGGCGEVGCSADGNGACGCKGFCDGHSRATECSPAPEGYQCSCYLDGNEVGTCSDFQNACDIKIGCCSMYFGGGL